MQRLSCTVRVLLGLLVCWVGADVARGDVRLGGAAERDGMAVWVSGVAVFSDGTPAAGATVTLMAHGGSAVSGGDGSFVIEARVPRGVAEVSVSALLMRGEQQWVGTGTGIGLEVGGGEAEAGVVMMGSLCEPEWVEGVGMVGLNDTVFALAVFDDGSGPALYAGGIFTQAGGNPANRIARWDGTSWSALGVGVNSVVNALAVFDDGSGPALYAGGFFSQAGGSSANRIARWNGSSWSALGAGLGGIGSVSALAVFDDGGGPALYAGGNFTSAGGSPVGGIARWDGALWSPLGVGVSGGEVKALAVFDDGSGPALYAGGSFTNAGGIQASRIARWDGVAWSPLGSGTFGGASEVRALAVFDDGAGSALYVGGSFSEVQGLPVNHIARWNGLAWSTVGAGVTGGNLIALTVFDDGSGPGLYAGGAFTQAGGSPVNRIARWDGSSWSGLGAGIGAGAIRALAVLDAVANSSLFAAGNFAEAGGSPAIRIAQWQGCALVVPEPFCGDPSAGDCCTANGTPFCNDAACCELICVADPFCCETSWDQLCANQAVQQCVPCFVCGSAQAGSCCVANSTPYCNNAACCTAVCAVDPFCCDTQWDGLCANGAGSLCDLCVSSAGACCFVDFTCQQLSASQCTSQGGLYLGDGADCSGCQVGCGAPLSGSCCENNGTAYCDDAACCEVICVQDPFCCENSWDQICANQATQQCVSCFACGSAESGDCCENNGTPYCNDAACCAAVCAVDPFCCATSWDSQCATGAGNLCGICVPSVGACCLPGFVCGLQTGADCLAAGGTYQGDGTTCGSNPCPSGCGDPASGSCCENNGTPFCDDAACCELICAADPFCCNNTWDGICANQAIDQCVQCFACGSAESGDCCVNNGTPYCDDAACCAAVCAVDPFCCTTSWDSLCATGAGNLCGGLCGTPCLADVNGDGVVDADDLGILLGGFGCIGANCSGDINGDGVVDADDLGIMLGEFGCGG